MNKIVFVGPVPQDAKDIISQRFQGTVETADAQTPADVLSIENPTYLIVRSVKYPVDEIEKLPGSVKLIARWGVGYDSVDIEAAGKRGIAVTICTGGNAQPVAELTVLLMLAACRRMPQLVERARAGRGDKGDLIAQSILLQNKLVGLIGFGNIGSKVSRIVQGFGAKVAYFDAFRLSQERELAENVSFEDLDTLLRTADIISIHAPLLDSTRGIINGDAFAKMKNTCILINTARGPIVDTEALMDAIKRGQIAAAALDTVAGEPLPAEHPIFASDRIIVTPHAGGNTRDNSENMAEIISSCIICEMENGHMPSDRYVVNKAFLKNQR